MAILDEFRLTVASPCSKTWDSLEGNDQHRHCNLCEKNVYNLSALTEAEVRALITEKEGKLCARFFLKQDGTVLTADCPVGRKAWRRKVRRVATVIVAFFGCLVGGLVALARPQRIDGSGQAIWTFASIRQAIFGWFETAPEYRPEIVGDMCLDPAPAPNAPAPNPTPDLAIDNSDLDQAS